MQSVQRDTEHGPADEVKRPKKAGRRAARAPAGDRDVGSDERLDAILLWLKINAYLASGRNLEFDPFVKKMEEQCKHAH